MRSAASSGPRDRKPELKASRGTYLCFWELVGDLTREGRSIVVVSHLLFERERFDRILRLESGRVQEDRQ